MMKQKLKQLYQVHLKKGPGQESMERGEFVSWLFLFAGGALALGYALVGSIYR